jgi:D-glycero-alpha-D-manno-heptose-7-phosphate kinase
MGSNGIRDVGLIMTRTPLRISLAGGGTDLAAFYERESGAVFSTAINKYIYVTVKRHGSVFNESIRVNYSRSETVQTVDQIENDIARECLRLLEIDPPIYISTVADLPASTGLGGSSSFAVGLLNALHAFRGERVSAGELAEEACHIEIEVLKQPIGKQDQYAAAFGGVNFFSFEPDGVVKVEPQRLKNGTLKTLFDSVLMFWTGHQRDSSSALSDQKANTPSKMDCLIRMREHAVELKKMTCNGSFSVEGFGKVLDETWHLKRSLSNRISTNQIDECYEKAMAAGAEGGKLCGAGGGGFLMFIVRPENQAAVCRALGDLKRVPVSPEAHGSQMCSPFSAIMTD